MQNKGLIIVNLGSPDSYAVKDVRAYLNEFLMDEKVMDIPWLQRLLLVKGFISPFRAPKSAEAYKSIWNGKDSPLKTITEEFARQLEPKVNIPVAIAMRYGNPTPLATLNELESKAGKLDEIMIAPMYPHYAMSSYETALDYVKEQVQKARNNIQFKVLKPFYNDAAYIKALVASIKPHLEKQTFDAYLFSYHGLPVRHLKKSDPTKNHCYISNTCCEVSSPAWGTCYKHQVKRATQLVTEEMNLEKDKVKISFQSRLGSDPWVEPYTDFHLKEFPAKGIKKLLVICPAFVADCLETLEEINIRGKESFLQNGGEELVYVPCLNTHPQWVETFASYCNQNSSSYAGLWTRL